MAKTSLLLCTLVPCIIGCASVSRTDTSLQPTSLYEISLQKPQPGLPSVLVAAPQTLKFSRRADQPGTISFAEELTLPAGKYKPMGQTEYGIFYESPVQITFEKSSGGLGGIVIPASGLPARIWVADFKLGVSPGEISANVAQAYLMSGVLITPFVLASPMVRGKETAVSLRYIDCPIAYRLEAPALR
jgi:hypothetical protein